MKRSANYPPPTSLNRKIPHRAPRNRCLVGYIFSPESFVAEENVAVERSLRVAVKTLQERADLRRKSTQMGQSFSATSFQEKAAESQNHAEVIRDILKRFNSSSAQSDHVEAD